ncbi:PD40 domain-containing protein [Alteromonas facilis]|uniref:PD40 domain-containing protein n=1 Tax=Alteromonas facilis TaxID=2048004 RepID=UPI000C28A0D5|nr:PD40 domain-containing protein [Alteromonas facilis]
MFKIKSRYHNACIAFALAGCAAWGTSFATGITHHAIEPILNDHATVDYGSSISPDGSTMYFTRAASDFSSRQLMVARLDDGKVVDVQPLLLGGKSIKGGDVQISPDGQTLTFCAELAIDRDAERKDRDLYYSTKTSTGWSAPKRFPDTINTTSGEFYPVLTHSGNLYFSRANEQTSMDVYVSEWVEGNYQPARKLGGNINTDLLESDAYISPDESFMLFVRMYEEGALGVSDIYLSRNTENGWSKPENLGPTVNFAGVDGSPFVTQDKQWLYFTSNRDASDPKKFDTHLGVFRFELNAVL